MYNNEGQNNGLYCKKHKKEEMINVIDRKCMEKECKTIPNFNFKEEKNGIYCNIHKKEEMIDVKNKRCIEKNCNTVPIYNFEKEKNAIYCKLHKKYGMINVKDIKCIEEGCTKIPNYNNEDQKTGIYCVTHKKPDMIDIKNKRCIEKNCNIQPNFNFQEKKVGLYCTKHKKDGMIDIINKHCITHNCMVQARPKYDGYCFNCFIHLFPDKPNSLNYKTKEKATSDYIIEHFTEDKYTWIADKKIEDGCSRKRPDLLLDLGYQVIIIEIDENQHQNYECSCENKRLMLLSQDISHRPIVFIRFNPDEYTSNKGKVSSCWGINGRGICTIKLNKKKEWLERLEALKNQIKYWITPDNKTDKTIEVIQLFYDTV